MSYSLLELVENHPGMISVAEAARLRGVSRKSIYQAIKAGAIPVVRDGIGVVRIDPKTWAHVLRRKNPMMREAAR
jgi:excisionase family DNA binding protein